jgi:hypothetical protein
MAQNSSILVDIERPIQSRTPAIKSNAYPPIGDSTSCESNGMIDQPILKILLSVLLLAGLALFIVLAFTH